MSDLTVKEIVIAKKRLENKLYDCFVSARDEFSKDTNGEAIVNGLSFDFVNLRSVPSSTITDATVTDVRASVVLHGGLELGDLP